MIIDTLIWEMQGDASKLKASTQEADQSVKAVKAEMEQADKTANQLRDTFMQLGKDLLLGLVAKGFTKALTDQADLGTAINQTAEIVGNSADAVNRFAGALNDAGEDVQSGLNMLEAFNQRVSQNEELLTDSGIATRNSNNELRDTLSIYQDLIHASQGMAAAQRAQYFRKFGLDPRMAVSVGDQGLVSSSFLMQAARRKKILDELATIQGQLKTKLGEMFMPALLAFEELRKKFAERIKHRFPEIVGALTALTAALLTARGAALALSLAMLAIKNPITAAAIATVAALGAVLGDVWGSMTPEERDTWLDDMAEALPNVTALVKSLMGVWDSLLESVGATSIWELMAKGVGKLLGYLDTVLGMFRKIGSFFGLTDTPTVASNTETGNPKPLVSDIKLPVLAPTVAEHTQSIAAISATQLHLTPSPKSQGLTVNDNRKIDFRPEIKVDGNVDKKVADHIVDKMNQLMRENDQKHWNDLAQQAASGVAR